MPRIRQAHATARTLASWLCAPSLHAASGLCAALLLAAGCAGTPAAEEENCVPAPAGGNRPGATAVNTVCPIVDADGADGTYTVEYKGRVIAFCCPTCIRKFNAMDEAAQDAVLVKATTYSGR